MLFITIDKSSHPAMVVVWKSTFSRPTRAFSSRYCLGITSYGLV